MNIYVGNFSPEITGEDLQSAFEAFGYVTFTQIVKDGLTGHSQGFGFVEMPNNAEAKNAIEKVTQISGERVVANEAKGRDKVS